MCDSGRVSGHRIVLPEEDRLCLWKGLDGALSAQQSEDRDDLQPQHKPMPTKWSVPPLLDPLPSWSEYNRLMEEQSALTAFRKKKGRESPLPPKLEAVEKRLTSMAAGHLAVYQPRKVMANQNIMDWLLRQRSGPANSCSFATDCCRMVVFWCFNNWALSESMLDYLYRRVAEEFKGSHEYGPYLQCIEELLLCKDANYRRKMELFIPKIMTLFRRCSKTDDTGTDLLLFQISSFLVRLSFKNGDAAKLVMKQPDVLEQCRDEYHLKHSRHHQYQHHGQHHAANNHHTNHDHHQQGNASSAKSRRPKGFNMRPPANH